MLCTRGIDMVVKVVEGVKWLEMLCTHGIASKAPIKYSINVDRATQLPYQGKIRGAGAVAAHQTARNYSSPTRLTQQSVWGRHCRRGPPRTAVGRECLTMTAFDDADELCSSFPFLKV